MATSSIQHPHYLNKIGCAPPSSFPDTFKDFFQTLNEDDDSVDLLASVLEDKLIPRSGESSSESGRSLCGRNIDHNRKSTQKRSLSTRHFQRRSSDAHARNVRPMQPQNQIAYQHNSLDTKMGPSTTTISPSVNRRRSSSIAVARTPPDLHRFLQAEQQRPWGHLTPQGPLQSPSSRINPHLSPASPTPTLSISPLGPCHSRLHLSPGTSPGLREPVSPRTKYATDYSRIYRTRTSSMPAVPKHRPMLAETRRSAIHCGESESEDVEYYRLRSFSITANGVFNLGDSLRSRRSRSINSVTSTGTSGSGNSRDRFPSSASQNSTTEGDDNKEVASYRVAMLGASGVGKTALTYQFTTSEYICAYDASLDEEYGQKTVSVLLDGQETELEIIDHPASEMSVESFCATYNVDMFVVVYSVVDRKSLKIAEEILLYLWKGDYMTTKGVILVANKADLERKREVPMTVGRRIANSCGCKFIETSSGLDHNVDELLVGILAQVKLNPKRNHSRQNLKRRHKMTTRLGSGRRILEHLLGLKRKTRSCENLFIL